MRLLHSILEFKDFFDAQIPPYVILSHTWGKDEVTYQDMRHLQKVRKLPGSMRQNRDFMAALEITAGIEFGQEGTISIEARTGYRKITETAAIAKKKGYNWFWIDTCCIDKSSSAELQEAINSMFAWYKRSCLCVVHLEGVFVDTKLPKTRQFSHSIRASKWLSRGWTLQELLAPRLIEFYDDTWSYICLKTQVLSSLLKATSIPKNVLATGEFTFSSVAQRMSWAAHRSTTRLEDEAYALLGIFDVQMPMLYGEGDKAFFRLQEQIARTTADDSIFSWDAIGSQSTTYRGPFARSPREFANCTQVRSGRGTYGLSNLGMRITLELMQVKSPHEGETLVAQLQSRHPEFDRGNWIILRKLAPATLPECQDDKIGRYARIFPDSSFYDRLELGKSSESTTYIDVQPQLGPGMIISAYHCFKFTTSHKNIISEQRSNIPVAVVDAHPKHLWSEEDHTLLVPQDAQKFTGVVRLSPVFNPGRLPQHKRWTRDDFYLLIGLRQLENNGKQAWAKTMQFGTLDRMLKNETSESLFRKSARHPAIKFDSDQLEMAWGKTRQGRRIEMYYDLFRDKISMTIGIQGLIRR